jgi:hypothetical protein
MESPRPLEDSKQIRWIGRPSEEQLLGPLPRPLREVPISFEPPPPPDWGLSETPAADEDGTATQRWRLGPRDFVALAAVAAVVWLAVRGSEGLPFRSSEPAAPAAAGEIVRTTLSPDRAEFGRAATQVDAQAQAGAKAGRQKDQSGSSGSDGKGDGNEDPGTGAGGGDEKTDPLTEATIPGVGTVRVEQPEVPTLPDAEAPTLPALPKTDDVLPEAPTVSLP